MNVASPEWASSFAASKQVLSPALRSAFEARNRLPVEFETLLKRLDGRSLQQA